MSFINAVKKSQETLTIIGSQKRHILTKAKFGPSKITKIPLYLSKELAFLVAAILGDGHLAKNKKRISIELTNLDLLNKISDLYQKIFGINQNIRAMKPRPNKKQSWQLQLDNTAVYLFFNQVFEVPSGKKSDKIRVPRIILYSNKEIKKSFLRGIMFTEGGKRRRGYGLSTASKVFQKDLVIMFNDVGISVQQDQWTHQRYKKEYYGLFFRSRDYFTLMRRCRSGQTGYV